MNSNDMLDRIKILVSERKYIITTHALIVERGDYDKI